MTTNLRGLLVCWVLVSGCGSPATTGVDAAADASMSQPSDPFYDPATIVDVELTIAPADLARLDADPFADTYVPGTFAAMGNTLDVGVRYKGNSSLARAGNKPSFKISVDEFVADQKFLGLKTINLNNTVLDPSMEREMVAYELFRDSGVPTSRANYARLTVNGTYYGLYVNVEQVNKAMLARWFAENDGNLYKQYAPATLEYRGSDPGAYAGNYIKKTNETANDWSDLIGLCELLASDDLGRIETELPTRLDTDGFLRWLAVSTFTSHVDTYTGLANNYYLYHDPTTDRFAYLPWDLDISFGTAGHGGTTTDFLLDWDIYDPRLPAPGPRPLLTKMMAVPSFRARYEQIFREVLDAGALAPRLAERFTAVRALIAPAALADDRKPYSDAAFDQSLTAFTDPADGMGVPIIGPIDFVQRRAPRVDAQLP